MGAMDIDRLLQDYALAWSEPDPSRREALLRRVWSEKGTYCDPNSQVNGRAALHAHIGKMHDMHRICKN